MGGIRDYQHLEVWRLGVRIAVEAYALTRRFPVYENYALADQIRRAASSVPANIAEGSARGSVREFSRSLRIARGSLVELHSHLCLARDLGYLSEGAGVLNDMERLHSMLNALIGSLKRRTRSV